MALDIRAAKYTTDDGQEFQLGVSQYIMAQVGADSAIKVGGAYQVSGDGTLFPLPKGFKPRLVKVSNASNGKSRTVVCLTPTSSLYLGTETTINLQDGAGVSLAYTRSGSKGENSRTRHLGV